MAATESTIRLVFDGSERGVLAAAAKARAAMRGLDDDNKRLKKSTDDVQKSVSGLVSSFVGKTGLLTIGLAAAGVGAVGTAAAAAVPALGGLAAAFATTKLGADGFKQAAQQLKKPVDDLKASLSGTFAKELTPAFAKLGPVISSLQGPMTAMAQQQAAIVRGLIDIVVNAQKLGQINAIIQGGTNLLAGMADGLNRLVAGMLAAGAAGAQSMRGLGEAVGYVLGRLGDVLQRLSADGTIAKGIDSLSATIRGLGDVAAPVVDIVLRMGAALGPSLGNALSQFGVALERAGPGLVDLAAAGGELLNALAPLLPTIGDVAGALASAFAGSIRALIPTVQALVGFLNAHKDQLVALAPIISSAATAYAEFKVLNAIRGWVSAAIGGLQLFATQAAAAGTAAEVAGAKTAAMGSKLGLIKGAAAAAALAGVAIAMDQVNVKAAGGADKLGLFQGQLHNIVGAIGQLASGDVVGIFNDISGELDQLIQKAQTGESVFGQFLGAIKRMFAEKLPPLTFDVNTGPATAQINGFMAAVSRNTATVNINGRTEQAGQALAELVQRVRTDPNAIVQINGQSMKAQDALNFVIGLINNSNPEVQINGQWVKAGDALAQFLAKAQGSRADPTLGLRADPADHELTRFVNDANAARGTAALDADKAPADGRVGEWVGGVSRTRGTAHLDAEPGGANATVAGWQGRANATIGTSHQHAEAGQANATTSGWQGSANRATGTGHQHAEAGQANATTSGWVGSANRATGTATLHANDGPARGTLAGLLRDWAGRVLTWTVNIVQRLGFSGGGPVPGRAGGGAIYGPGTGTSDTAGLYALSRGEHVLTAREVQAAGGHAAIFAMRRALVGGRVPRMTATRGHAASGGTATPAGALRIPAPQVNVQVHVDGNALRSIVRTEITDSSRATRRTVLAGAGTSF